jgi:GNAT superfamily N-acetyltransferase
MSGGLAMTTAVRIVPASLNYAGTLANLIAEAFQHLDIACWLVGDPAERRRVLGGNFRLFVDHALTYGTVHTTVDRAAVAVWLPAAPIPDIADYDAHLALVCGAHTDRFRALDAAMHAAHPAGPPHEHLAFLAVHPQRQGAGVGSALLAHRHRLLDAQGTPAYLEASSERSRALYLRHGYRRLGEPLRPAPDGPPMWPMWRQPPSPWATPPRVGTQTRPEVSLPDRFRPRIEPGPDRADGQEAIATDPAP